MIAGYSFFFADPQLNLAKTLIATFGLLNTFVILIQIHVLYGSKTKLASMEYVGVENDTEIGYVKMLKEPLLAEEKRQRKVSDSYELPVSEASFHSINTTPSKAANTDIKIPAL